MKKEEAKEKYDVAVASGNTAVHVEYDEDVADIIKLSLGSIQPS